MSGVLGQAQNTQTGVRSKCIDVHARIRLDRSRQELINVALALVVDATAADVADLDRGSPADIALERGVPVPRCRDLEHRVLTRQRKWKQSWRGAGGRVGVPVDNRGLRLEGRVAAESGVAIDGGAVREHADARS